jgi:hypothetical protein
VGYDEYPVEVMVVKEALLKEAFENAGSACWITKSNIP